MSTTCSARTRRSACIVQVESAAALANLDAIARVDGVDGVFLGPADLAASLGHRGEPAHPVVREALERAIAAHHRRRKAGRHPHERRDARARLPRRGLQLRRGGRRHDAARARDIGARGAFQASAAAGSSPRAAGLTAGHAHAQIRPVPADGAAAGPRAHDELLPPDAQRARAHRAAVARHPRAAGIRRARVPRPVARGLDPAGEPDGHPHAARTRRAGAADTLAVGSTPPAPLAVPRPGCDDSRPSASKRRSATDRSSDSSGGRGSRR